MPPFLATFVFVSLVRIPAACRSRATALRRAGVTSPPNRWIARGSSPTRMNVLTPCSITSGNSTSTPLLRRILEKATPSLTEAAVVVKNTGYIAWIAPRLRRGSSMMRLPSASSPSTWVIHARPEIQPSALRPTSCRMCPAVRRASRLRYCGLAGARAWCRRRGSVCLRCASCLARETSRIPRMMSIASLSALTDSAGVRRTPPMASIASQALVSVGPMPSSNRPRGGKIQARQLPDLGVPGRPESRTENIS